MAELETAENEMDTIREAVRERYAAAAVAPSSGASCCEMGL